MRSHLGLALLPVVLVAGCSLMNDFGDFSFAQEEKGLGGGDGGAGNGEDGGNGGNEDGGGCEKTETTCDDQKDDDCDKLIDCEDSDCAMVVACCVPSEVTETVCGGSMDEDCDGKIDCADEDCRQSTECCPSPQSERPDPSAVEGKTRCEDGIDNDCDGLTDCGETSSCGDIYFCTCKASGAEGFSEGAASCIDGNDNDCDQKADCEELRCQPHPDCCMPTEMMAEVSCTDGVNNDCDAMGADCADDDCNASFAGSNGKGLETEGCADPKNCPACNDAVDDDCDGLVSCDDPDCGAAIQCCKASSGEERAETSCADDFDNDCDGLKNCADPDCAKDLAAGCCEPPAGGESTDALCTDGVDSDCDTQVDCDDAQCSGVLNCCPSVLASNRLELVKNETGSLCSDGFDNDCDGRVNCADPDCSGEAGCPCLPSNEGVEINDGKDNDCDGYLDLPPTYQNTSPAVDLPVSGAARTFTTSAPPSGGVLQCRRTRRRDGFASPWVDCGTSGTNLSVYGASESKAAAGDGVWRGEFRIRYANGVSNSAVSPYFYIHHTLHGVAPCAPLLPDATWFAKAAERLLPPGGDDPGAWPANALSLKKPFVNLTYNLPLSATFGLGGSDKREILSLRHRFTRSPDGKLLLITRDFPGHTSGTCNSMDMRVHDTRGSTTPPVNFPEYTCAAVVLNRSGAGVCLGVGKGQAYFVKTSVERQASFIDYVLRMGPVGFPGTHRFMWRQIITQDNFTQKCETAGCGEFFLPDRAFAP